MNPEEDTFKKQKNKLQIVEFVYREEMEAPIRQEIIIMKPQGTAQGQNIAQQDFQTSSNS